MLKQNNPSSSSASKRRKHKKKNRGKDTSTAVKSAQSDKEQNDLPAGVKPRMQKSSNSTMIISTPRKKQQSGDSRIDPKLITISTQIVLAVYQKEDIEKYLTQLASSGSMTSSTDEKALVSSSQQAQENSHDYLMTCFSTEYSIADGAQESILKAIFRLGSVQYFNQILSFISTLPEEMGVKFSHFILMKLIIYPIHSEPVLEFIKTLAQKPKVREMVDANEGSNPLWLACSLGKLEAVKILCEAHANLEFRHEEEGTTPLLIAVINERDSIVVYLLELFTTLKTQSYAPNIDLQSYLAVEGLVNSDERTAIEAAALSGNTPILTLLLNAARQSLVVKVWEKITRQNNLTFSQNTTMVVPFRNVSSQPEISSALIIASQNNVGYTLTLEVMACFREKLYRLFRAVDNDDKNKINAVIDAGDNPNLLDEEGYPALWYAIKYQKTDAMPCLLEHKLVDVTTKSAKGETVLMLLASTRTPQADTIPQIATRVLDRVKENKDTLNEFVNFPNSTGQSATHVAAKSGHLPMLDFLLQNSARPENTDEQGDTPLHVAATGSELKVLEKLSQALGKKIDTQNSKNGETALMTATRSDKPDFVRHLLQTQADIWKTNNSQTNVLMIAAGLGNSAVAKLLLEHCPQPQRTAYLVLSDSEGYTAPMLALQNGHFRFVDECFSYLDSNIRDVSRKSHLRKKTKSGLNLFKCLLVNRKLGSQVRIATFNYIFSKFQEPEKQEKFTDESDFNEEQKDFIYSTHAEGNIHGITTLMLAARHNQHAETEFLLDVGTTNVRAATSEGWTAFRYAAKYGSVDVLRLLTNHVHAEDIRTAKEHYDRTKSKGQLTGGDFKSEEGEQDFSDPTSMALVDAQHRLHTAVERGDRDEVTKLLTHQYGEIIHINLKDARADHPDNPPLIIAAQRGYTAIVAPLISEKADVKIVNSDNETALMVAVRNNHPQVVNTLCEIDPSLLAIDTSDGNTALTLACSNKQTNSNLIKTLITADQEHVKKGNATTINTPNPQGETPLILAAKIKFEGAIVLLCGRVEIDVQKHDSTRNTALSYVVQNNDITGVRLILAKISSVAERDQFIRFPNEKLQSAWDLAVVAKNTEIILEFAQVFLQANPQKEGVYLFIDHNNTVAKMVESLIDQHSTLAPNDFIARMQSMKRQVEQVSTASQALLAQKDKEIEDLRRRLQKYELEEKASESEGGHDDNLSTLAVRSEGGPPSPRLQEKMKSDSSQTEGAISSINALSQTAAKSGSVASYAPLLGAQGVFSAVTVEVINSATIAKQDRDDEQQKESLPQDQQQPEQVVQEIQESFIV